MTTNPYSAPTAHVTSELEEELPPAQKPRSVWTLQVLGVLFTVFLIVKAVNAATMFLSHQAAANVPGFFLFTFGWYAVLAIFSGSAIVTAQRRKLSGLILGLLWITMVFASCVFTALRHSTANDPMANDAAYMFGRHFAQVVMPIACIYWFYAYGFSRKARDYFVRGRKIRVE